MLRTGRIVVLLVLALLLVLLCGTGLGMAITANKVPGIRATPCNDTISASFQGAANEFQKSLRDMPYLLALAGNGTGSLTVALNGIAPAASATGSSAAITC
jgi:hypothetical protein